MNMHDSKEQTGSLNTKKKLSFDQQDNMQKEIEDYFKTNSRYTPLTRSDFDLNVIHKWRELITKSAPKRRCRHLSFIYNDELYIFGGMDINEGKADDLYKINLTKIENEPIWVKIDSLGALPEPLAYQSGVLCDDNFYMFGGENNNNTATNNLYIYDIPNNKWEKRIFGVKNIYIYLLYLGFRCSSYDRTYM
jgi:hypothetical protein